MPCSAQVLAAKCFKTEQLCANILPLGDSNTAYQNIAHRCFYTEGCLYTGVLLYTGAFTQRCLSPRHAFTHGRLHAQMLLFGDAFTRSYLYAQVLLHRDAFTQELLDTCAFTPEVFRHRVSFTQRSFCTNTLTRRFFKAQIHLYRGFFETQPIHRYFYKEVFCTDAFTQRCFYTQGLLEVGRL